MGQIMNHVFWSQVIAKTHSLGSISGRPHYYSHESRPTTRDQNLKIVMAKS